MLQENQNLEEAQKESLIAWLSYTAEDHKRIALLADSIQRGVGRVDAPLHQEVSE